MGPPFLVRGNRKSEAETGKKKDTRGGFHLFWEKKPLWADRFKSGEKAIFVS